MKTRPGNRDAVSKNVRASDIFGSNPRAALSKGEVDNASRLVKFPAKIPQAPLQSALTWAWS